jgi:hypothetical protein
MRGRRPQTINGLRQFTGEPRQSASHRDRSQPKCSPSKALTNQTTKKYPLPAVTSKRIRRKTQHTSYRNHPRKSAGRTHKQLKTKQRPETINPALTRNSSKSECLTRDCSLVYSWKVWRVVSSAPALPSSCLKLLFSGVRRSGRGPVPLLKTNVLLILNKICFVIWYGPVRSPRSTSLPRPSSFFSC